MKRIVIAALACAILFAVVGEASALSPIKRIRSAAEFKGRQSVRLGAFKPFTPLPKIDTGAANVAEARNAIAHAITKTEAAIKDQNGIRQNYARQLGSLTNSIKGCQSRLGEMNALKAQFTEELSTLQGISNPSAAIQQCITELQEDIRQVNARIAAVNAQMANLKSMYAKLQSVGKGAAINMQKLQAALAELKQAMAKVAALKIPEIKIPEIKMPGIKIPAVRKPIRPVRPTRRIRK